MILFFDTETTGMVDFKAPFDAEHQPDLVQLAALLMEDDGTERGCLSTIVRPYYDHEIESKAYEAHGISLEKARECGISLVDAICMLVGMWDKADLVVAHNIVFDRLVLRTAFHRCPAKRVLSSATRRDVRSNPGFYCTMKAATPVCNLPGRWGKLKWPTLSECIQYFFDEDLEGAHDALVDVRACARVYFALQEGAKANGQDQIGAHS